MIPTLRRILMETGNSLRRHGEPTKEDGEQLGTDEQT